MLYRIVGPITNQVMDVVNDISSHFEVPEGSLQGSMESDEFRTGMKRRASGVSRSQYEVYTFSTKHDFSEAAIHDLLRMLSNVSNQVWPLTVYVLAIQGDE